MPPTQRYLAGVALPASSGYTGFVPIFARLNLTLILFLMSTTATLRHLIVPLAATLLLLPGCGDSKEEATPSNQLAFNDYEAVVGWMPEQKSVTRERAHSGHYAVKVDGANEYGMGYSMVLSRVLDHKPRKMHVEGWGYMTDAKSNARLDFQLVDLTNSNKAAFDDGIDYGTAIKDYGKWVKISKDITLPENLNSAQELRVFLWRGAATTPAYIDDLRISEAQ